MHVNNTIHILQTLDGYRIIQVKNIEELYYWYNCCENPNIQLDALVTKEDNLFHDQCQNCSILDPLTEKRKLANPKMIKKYFGKCTVYETKGDVLEEATNIFEEHIDENIGGISFVVGYEDKFFPGQEIS